MTILSQGDKARPFGSNLQGAGRIAQNPEIQKPSKHELRVSANPSEAGRSVQNHRGERTSPAAARCVCRGFSQGACGDPVPGGEAALRIGKRQSLEPHAHSGIRYAGRCRRSFRSPWRWCAARELPRRPFGLRRKDEAFDPSRHRSEARGESYKLSRSIGERREERMVLSRRRGWTMRLVPRTTASSEFQ